MAGLSSQPYYLWVRPGAYPRIEDLKQTDIDRLGHKQTDRQTRTLADRHKGHKQTYIDRQTNKQTEIHRHYIMQADIAYPKVEHLKGASIW